MKLKIAKKYHQDMFDCLVNFVRKRASAAPKTFLSCSLNILINYLSELILFRERYRSDRCVDFESVEKEFLAKLGGVDVISFDIFDTLLLRRVLDPADLFMQMELELKEEGFCVARINAENRARISLNGGEVTLEDIYEFVPRRFKKLLKVEKKFERASLLCNPKAKILFEHAVRSRKKVVAVSDMYLDKEFLCRVLEANGYNRLEEVFVSSQEKVTKSSGKLFFKVAKCLNVNPSRILHVGDNRRADYVKALEAGWTAIWMPKIQNQMASARKKYWALDKKLASSIHNSLVCRYSSQRNIWHEYGYMLGGPIVLSYLFWLIHHAQLSGVDHLAFIGRDGWILKKMYDKYFRMSGLSSSYVYLPRVVSILSTLKYNGCPEYLRYILKRACDEHVQGLSCSNIEKENIREFKENFDVLLEWASARKKELELHLQDRIGNASNPAFVELTSIWLTSFSAGHSVFTKENQNNFVLWFFGDLSKVDVGNLPFEAAFAGGGEYKNVYNRLLKQYVSVVDILESVVSSPENPVVELKDGNPVFAKEGGKSYYSLLELGVEDYLKDFLSNFSMDESHVLSVPSAIRLFRQFAQNIDHQDKKILSLVKHSSYIDNIKSEKGLL